MHARAGHYNSASSQFYIVTTRDSRELNCLNGAYAVFGKVLEAWKIVEAISAVETGAEHMPLHPQVIRRIRVEASWAGLSLSEATPARDPTLTFPR